MGDNQNRGPGDAFRRGQGGRKRREPPVIDGTATPVPSEAELTDESANPPLPGEEPGTDSPSAAYGAEAPADPLAHRAEAAAPEPLPASATDPSVAGEDAATLAPSEAALEPPADEHLSPVSFASGLDDTDARAGEAIGRDPASEPRPAAAAYVAPAMSAQERAGAPRRGSALPALLGVVIAILLAALLGLLYAGPRLTGSADLAAQVDALNQRVATLEARPQAAPAAEPAQPAADLGAIEARSTALEGAVGDLKTALADLTSKLDAVTQQAAADGAKITTLEQGAGAPVPPSAGVAPPATATQPAEAETPPGASPAAPVASEQTTAPAEAAAPVDLGPVQSRIADLGQRLDALQASVAALPKVDPQAIDERIAGMAGKMAETDQRVAAAAATLAAVPKIDLSPLQASIAEVDKRLVPIEAALSAPKDGDRVSEVRAEGSAEETRAAPLAVVAGAVSRALDEGRPFGPEIDALHGLGLDDAALGPLPALAATGAPTPDALKEQWASLETDVLTASVPKTGDSVIDRFAAGARNLVQVRRVGAASGDDPSAVSARINAALDHADLAGALAEWAKLPAASQAVSKAWADAVRGRLEAEAEARSLLARAVAALAKAKG